VIAGLLLAVGCALAGSVAVLLKQRGAVAGTGRSRAASRG
jgi:hypothetical protein